ncbi:MAG: hypothetical protein KR126chlam5_01585 [Candidatus Anoxychlamydiales bacterium]|nr:hypothetical protein [Candidatus Anoxychlamydiales bacterium]
MSLINLFDFLPSEMVVKIVLNLNITDLFAFGLTSRVNNALVKSDILWKQFLTTINFEQIVKRNASWNTNFKTIEWYSRDQQSLHLIFRSYIVDMIKIMKMQGLGHYMFPINNFEKFNKISDLIEQKGRAETYREAHIQIMSEKDGMTREQAEELYDAFN